MYKLPKLHYLLIQVSLYSMRVLIGGLFSGEAVYDNDLEIEKLPLNSSLSLEFTEDCL